MSFSTVTVLDNDGTGIPVIDPATGLETQRTCVRFTPDAQHSRLTVYYNQWLKGLDGSIVDLKEKAYYVYDADAVVYSEGEDMGGGNLALGGEIKVEAKAMFDHWKKFVVSAQMVGLTLEQLFVEMQINPRLKRLPIDVSDLYDNT